MATITKFEDLKIWQEARRLAKWHCEKIKEPRFSKDYGLRDQSCRSVGSIMDNIAEGFERSGTREFIQFLAIAKGSCGEFRSQLYRMLDFEYITESEFNEKFIITKELGESIGAFMSYLRKSNIKGSKFKAE